jgi:predicted patatin/cPLA2 family phospholipase
MKLKTILYICMIASAMQSVAQTTTLPYKIGNKILVISGGGARGAWGVGLVDTLIKSKGAYKAVMGISTGSTMGPLVLAQQLELLKHIYSTTTQEKIFNVNPFKVKKDKNGITTKPRLGLAAWRMIRGKKTIGESKNLRKLIDIYYSDSVYNTIISNQLQLAVGVTNMTTGEFELKLSDYYSHENMKDWIWASANQPLWMSYTTIDGNDYVDGGVRQVVPLEDAVKYAVLHNLDTIDVIVNNNFDPILKDWQASKKSWLSGLIRTLEVYGVGTHQYSLKIGKMLADLTMCENTSLMQGTINTASKNLVVSFYFMPQHLAEMYRNELAFDQELMKKLIKEGKNSLNPISSLPDSKTKLKTLKLSPKSNQYKNSNIIQFNIDPKLYLGE